MSVFSFSFSGDDIEPDTEDLSTPSINHAAETGSFRPRVSSGAFPVAGQPLLPPVYHSLSSLLSALPSKIAYSTLKVKLGANIDILIPRRELWDVRIQLMAEDEGEGVVGMGNDDVKTGVYEGGFKSWESSIDLVTVINERGPELGHRSVLELGCGTALPSIAIFQWFIQQPDSTATASLNLGLADYNPTVLQLVTLPNLLLSWLQITRGPSFELEGEIDIDESLISEFTSFLLARNVTISFFSGAWSPEFVVLVRSQMNTGSGNTMLIGAETIYSPSALKAFAETLMNLLDVLDGEKKTALVGAKKVYFGVGGSIEDFCEMVRGLGGMVQEVKEESVGVRRVVVEVRRDG